ncbi:putative monogalactosyldiacylglycerol synthase 2, chloroplastic, partial [Ananas comosus]
MVMSVVEPRRSIREALLHGVLGGGGGGGGARRGPSPARRCGSYAAGSREGLAAALEEEPAAPASSAGAGGGGRPKNVLVLMSDTGGGHRASAEAIRDAFRLEFGDEYQVFVKDLGKEYGGWPLNDMERSYKFMLRHARLWKVAFHGTSPRWVHCIYLAALAAFYAKKVVAGLMEYSPDIIVSVHPLMQHIPLWVLKWQSLQQSVPFVTVVTDLNTCHPTWFHTSVTRCYCPSQEVAKRALFEGLDPSQIRVFGLPIRPSFCRAVLNKGDLRKELEMDPHLPAVLLMGGGEGMGPVEETALALDEALYDYELDRPVGQIVVICGRNQALRSTLESTEWTVPVKVRGFESQMERWMGACDCIITKAGPGTITEALIRGLPIILNDFIPGQEVGNVPYVVDNGAGVFSKDPQETAGLVARWFGPEKALLKKFSRNALRLAQPNAVFDIVRDIHSLIRQRGPVTRVSYSVGSSFPFS